MRSGTAALALAAGIAAFGVALRATEFQQPTFRSSAAVVSLFATVTDAQRRLVPDLTQADFQVFDNDKPQPVTVFDNQIRPITVVVMLDTSGSMTNNLDLLRQGAEQFLIRLLPQDKGQVGAFNDKIQTSDGFTADRDHLISEVKDLDYGNGTRLWDAVGLSLDDLRGIDGRRVVLVFTDGDDTASHMGLGQVTDRAREDETMVYGIGFQSVYFDGVSMVKSRPDRGLKRLVDETGGGYFELQKSTDLGPTFSRVALELHSQYVIGFEPKQLDGKVHKLTVKMKQPGMTARARQSYIADPAHLH
jgi:Ca-activated chloride channel family protein